jgi:hypothetical protein
MALLGLALALEPDQACRLELAAGAVVEGRVYGAEQGTLLVSSGGEQVRVPLALVDRAWVDGEPVDPAQLRAELPELELETLERLELGSGLRRPPPALVAVSSAIWPGSGHLMLGDVGSFVGYTAIQASLVGVGAYVLLVEERAGPLLPLAVVDLTFRSWAVADATRTARRRRPALALAPNPDGGFVVMMSGPLGRGFRP